MPTNIDSPLARRIAAFAFLVFIFGATFWVLSPFFAALAWAGILAYVTWPLHQRLHRLLPERRCDLRPPTGRDQDPVMDGREAGLIDARAGGLRRGQEARTVHARLRTGRAGLHGSRRRGKICRARFKNDEDGTP